MIHHISIDAQNPLQVASVLAEIWKGKVYQFLIPGSFLVIPFDSDGTHVVVLKRGDVWTPGNDAESAKIRHHYPLILHLPTLLFRFRLLARKSNRLGSVRDGAW